jgi:hypothetical protein
VIDDSALIFSCRPCHPAPHLSNVLRADQTGASHTQSLNLPEPTRAIINQIRSSDPARRVRSIAGNVSAFYPSRKMKRTIQFESHRNELAAILEMEHDPDVIEFYDQPNSIKRRCKALRERYDSSPGRTICVYARARLM